MIKNTVIIILIILLFIALYSYYSLSNNMVNYQKDRMKIILEKEKKLNTIEINLDKINTCNKELTKYKNIINTINKSLTELNVTNNNVEQKKSPESVLISEYLHNDGKCSTPLNEQIQTETEIIPLAEEIIMETETERERIPFNKQIDIDFNSNTRVNNESENIMSPNTHHTETEMKLNSSNNLNNLKPENKNIKQENIKLENNKQENIKLENIKPENNKPENNKQENNKSISGVYNKPEDYIKSNRTTNEEHPRPPFI